MVLACNGPTYVKALKWGTRYIKRAAGVRERATNLAKNPATSGNPLHVFFFSFLFFFLLTVTQRKATSERDGGNRKRRKTYVTVNYAKCLLAVTKKSTTSRRYQWVQH